MEMFLRRPLRLYHVQHQAYLTRQAIAGRNRNRWVSSTLHPHQEPLRLHLQYPRLIDRREGKTMNFFTNESVIGILLTLNGMPIPRIPGDHLRFPPLELLLLLLS